MTGSICCLRRLFAGVALVALSLVGTSAFAATATYVSGPGLGLDIPDFDPAGVSDTISVGDSGIITRLAVVVSIDHTWVGDLIWTLTGPDGTTITLANRPGTGGGGGFGDSSNLSSDFGVIFGERSPIAADFMGGGSCNDTDSIVGLDCYRFFAPEDSFSAFYGTDVLGDWTLTLSDNAELDTGSLNGWLLAVEYQNGDLEAVPVPGAVWLLGSALMGLGAWRRRS